MNFIIILIVIVFYFIDKEIKVVIFFWFRGYSWKILKESIGYFYCKLWVFIEF